MHDETRAQATAGLPGRVVVVTGGGGGIGGAVCQAAAAAGAAVVLVDVAGPQVDRTVAEIAARTGRPHDVLGLVLDVAREADMARMAQVTLDRFGGIDVLVTCAGILRGRGCLPHPVTEVSLQEWDQVVGANLTGVFLSNRAVLPSMIERRRGDILNISSTSGRQGRANDSAYCASKFGVVGFSEAIGEEVRPYGVRVQVLLPDAVQTSIWQQNGPIRPEDGLDPARVADLILYLVTLPEDTIMPAPVIAPFRTRRRVRTDARDDGARRSSVRAPAR